MATIAEIAEQRGLIAPHPPADPLTIKDGLEEAWILDIHYNLRRQRLVMLLDLRTSIFVLPPYEESNTGLFIAHNVSEVSLEYQPVSQDQRGLLVASWSIERNGDNYQISIEGFSSHAPQTIRCTSHSMECFLGNVANIGECAADMAERSEFLRTTPNWNSVITITYQSYIGQPQ